MPAVSWLLLLLACVGPGDPGLLKGPGASAWPETERAAAINALQARVDAGLPPRTRHLDSEGQALFTNRLVLENSPYLLQHAHNPVDWQSWGDAPFEQARAEDKLVVLSVGYATCHWCHVMEEESFEDLAIAERMNRDFVAIKVDREQRPDVDGVYMKAVQALTGRGGWPMTVVLTPDRVPVFAGTYLPARTGDRGTRMGFEELLTKLAADWKTDRAELVRQADELSQRMQAMSRPPPPATVPTLSALDATVAQMAGRYDAQRGGFGRAPRFPRPAELLFLLSEHRRTGEELPKTMALRTLDAIVEGGIRDHLGGGFHRYTVDADWTVPHFEKMAYDQAQLVLVLLEAHQLTGEVRYRDAARETLDYVVRELKDPASGFHCASDADSLNPAGERVEGWFFTWTPAELDAALGADAALARSWYGVSDSGQVDGRSVLTARRTRQSVAEEAGLTLDELDAKLVSIRRTLFQARAKRPRPLQDDKVVMGWNALLVSALARGAFQLQEPAYGLAARTATRFATRQMTSPGGGLYRSWRQGVHSHDGVLEDYALQTLALLDLYETTGEGDWVFLARATADQMNARFGRDEGGWWETAHDAETLLTRSLPSTDGALPSGNSVAIEVHLRLAALTGEVAWQDRADKALAVFGPQLARSGSSAPWMLRALAMRLGDTRQVVLVPGEGLEAMREVLRTTYAPNTVVAQVLQGYEHSSAVAIAKGKPALDGKATAYVCYEGLCEAPTTDPSVFRAQLTEQRE